MIPPRVSIGWLMLAVALIGFHLAIVRGDLPVLGLEGLEVGLLPGVTVLTVIVFSNRRRVAMMRPFARGFVASLSVAIGVYLVCCLTVPDLVRWPVVYYINEIELYILDADFEWQYRLSQEIYGLILGMPQLLLAMLCAGFGQIVFRSA